MARSRRRPALTREALHLISSNHVVPSARAREQLGHQSLVDYQAAMKDIADYVYRTGGGSALARQ